MKSQGLPINTIVLGGIGVIVLIILAVVFVPAMGDIFGTIGGVSGQGGETFLSDCNLKCMTLSSRYSSISVARSAAVGTFCSHTDDLGNGCQYYMECRITLVGTIGQAKVWKRTDGVCYVVPTSCTEYCPDVTCSGSTPVCITDNNGCQCCGCNSDSDCGIGKTCSSPRTCNSQCV